MDALIRRRGSVKSAFTRLQGFLDSPDVNTCSIDQLNSRLEKLGENWRQAENIFMEICVACEEDDLPGHEEEHSQMEERFFTLQEVLSRLSRQQSPPASRRTSGADNQQNITGDVKLPRLDLPKFNGDYKEWTAFHDQFVASVHNNAKLSGSQKLNYLKSCLKDDACNLLRSVSITDANYQDAWDILIERYQNKRNIVNAHMKTLFSQVPLQSESASQLRKLLDTSVEHVRALKVLEQPTDMWDTVLIYHLSTKMDSESRRQWELSLVPNELPTFEQLTTFLKKRCGALEMFQPTEKPLSNSPYNNNNGKYKATHSYHVSAEKPCVICKQAHLIYKCQEFLRANVKTRAELVKKNRLCYNCLREFHSSSQCQSGSCRQCQGKHHTLLHYESSEQSKNQQNEENMIAPIISNHMSNLILGKQVLLGTAIIHVTDCKGNLQPCRAVLDSASQATFISEKCMQRLGLQRRQFNQPICGIGSSDAGKGRGITTINFQSALSEFRATLDVIIMDKVTGILPSYPIANNKWTHLQNIPLADPIYYQQSEMDILLGNEITPHLMMDGKKTGPEGSPIAQNTVLGWVLGGTIFSEQSNSDNYVQLISNHSTLNISEQLQEFWRIEELPSNSTALSLDEKLCETHFQQTHSRNSNGSFIVEIPFKSDNTQLGNSIQGATVQLKQIEKNLTNSTIVLACIASHLIRWKNFVANRVSEIQDLILPEQWDHVISQENPADCATRGVLPADLCSHPLWWKGPDSLLQNKSAWKINNKNLENSTLPEPRKIISLVATTNSDLKLFSACSSLTKLVRVMAYCKRFIFNSKRDYWEVTRRFLCTQSLLLLAIIIANHSGIDDIHRVVVIKLKHSILKRSIAKVSPLPFNCTDCI